MRVALVLLALGGVASCGDRGRDAEREARSVSREAEAKARGYGDEVADRAAQVKDSALALGDRALDRVTEAADLAQRAKAELDKVYRTNTDYDLDITSAKATSAHAAKLAAMPHVTVGGVTVGYEEVVGVSTTGGSRKRHFRATSAPPGAAATAT